MTDEIWKKVKFNLFWSYMRDLLIRVEYLYLFFKEILRVLLHVFLTYFDHDHGLLQNVPRWVRCVLDTPKPDADERVF